MKKMKKFFWLLAASLCFPVTSAFAGSIAIDTVKVDQTAGELYITGTNLTKSSFTSVVTLSGKPLFVCSDCYTGTNITASLPPELLAGDYTLKVFITKKNSVEYSLTIGAVGPQGEQELKGDTGAVVPQGHEK
jgi:hypothetical protein